MSVRLADRLISARRRRFVGRSPELAQLQSALSAGELPFQLLFVNGPGALARPPCSPNLGIWLSKPGCCAPASTPAMLSRRRRPSPAPCARPWAERCQGTMLLYLRAFPDLGLVAEDIFVQDDRVAMSWILCGTHRGILMNIPATGCSVKVRGVSIMTIADGHIQRTCRVWDLAGLLRAFGLLPELS